jgi:CRISPR-associated protein Csb2
MLAIAWQYLSGRATAAEVDHHDRPEWPAHPDRVFQALVAAWGERGGDPAERAALHWLERQDPPDLTAPEIGEAARQVTKAYVPVNDKSDPMAKGKLAQPIRDTGLHSDRKDRFFASVFVGPEAVCALLWPKAEPAEHDSALRALCAAVTHVGHSRSLVRMWVEEQPPRTAWTPSAPGARTRAGELRLRVPHAGRLERLEQAHAALLAGRLARNAWPPGQWRRYVRCAAEETVWQTPFDPRLVILRRVGGEGRTGLPQAPAFVGALRAALMKAGDGTEAMRWLSGHEPGGPPLQEHHVAFLPLAHVGHEHADGHLLGLGVALPRGLPPDTEQAILAVLGGAAAGQGRITLTAGVAGTMELEEDNSPGLPWALRAQTWTGPSCAWGTVTPVALDRLPPRRHENDDTWAAGQLAEACRRLGLPAPAEVHVLPVAPHIGAPAAREFPPLRRRPDGARRWHVHAVLRFGQLVQGPLLLGAGRYRGYGLFKPLPDGSAASG